MTVQEFVNKYKYRKDEKAKEKFISDRLKTSYLPFIDKCNICERIARASSLDATNKYMPHSALNYLLYMLSLVDAYTDIDVVFIDNGEITTDKQYDLLKESGLLEKLINLIPEQEATEFSMLIGFANDDLSSANCDLHVVVDNAINRIADGLAAVLSLIDYNSIKMVLDNGTQGKVD